MSGLASCTLERRAWTCHRPVHDLGAFLASPAGALAGGPITVFIGLPVLEWPENVEHLLAVTRLLEIGDLTPAAV